MTRDPKHRSRADPAVAELEGAEAIKGVLCFDYEQGTRGGYWAIQDKRFITPNETRFVCRKCSVYWDKEDEPHGPSNTIWLYNNLPPPGHEPESCPAGQHDFDLVSNETWSYDGLHVLADDDLLAIYDKGNPNLVVWSGTIRLRSYPHHTEKASGCWIHARLETHAPGCRWHALRRKATWPNLDLDCRDGPMWQHPEKLSRSWYWQREAVEVSPGQDRAVDRQALMLCAGWSAKGPAGTFLLTHKINGDSNRCHVNPNRKNRRSR